MAPARSLLLRHCNSYGAGCFPESHFPLHQQIKTPLIPLLMAEEGSTSSSKKPPRKEQEQEGHSRESTTTSKEEQRVETYEAGWLQLGVASAPAAGQSRVSASASAGPSGGSMELRLFPEKPPPLLLPTPAPPAEAITRYGVGRLGWRPESSGSAVGAAPVGDLRVVNPPQLARSGVWIALRPSENQVNEPFLPQLHKSYLRIKDGRMTIRLLMRYLANKLGLQDESEVEISCRSQQLLPYATLEDVRDHIWCARDTEAPEPSSPAIDHLMMLHYSSRSRRASARIINSFLQPTTPPPTN